MTGNNKNNLKFVFFGTPDVASETLEILKQSDYLPSLIVTAPDRPSGRKMILTPPPVKTWAIENNIPYIQPEKLNELTSPPTPPSLAGEGGFDLYIVVAYGKIMPEDLIKDPKLGSINIHYSLLPKYRGASPVESAVLNGDKVTGITIQQMKYKMDSGPILAKEEVKIGGTETAPELKKRLIKIGGELLVKMLPEFIEGRITPVLQDEAVATFCKKIKKEDGQVDSEKESSETLYNKFRAYANWPRIFYFDEKRKRIIISDAILENNNFVIRKVIPEGRKEIAWEEYNRE